MQHQHNAADIIVKNIRLYCSTRERERKRGKGEEGGGGRGKTARARSSSKFAREGIRGNIVERGIRSANPP